MKFIVTKKEYVSEGKMKATFREEYKSEMQAFSQFSLMVQQYTSLSFAFVQPVSITMLDEFNTAFATFQIR